MTDDVRDILLTFARQLQEALAEAGDESGAIPSAVRTEHDGCLVKQLPQKLWQQAAQTAVEHYPGNHPSPAGLAQLGEFDAQRIALLTTKYWGPMQRKLTVSFLSRASSSLRAKILQYMNRWSTRCGISFQETTGTGQVRISLGPGGYWSYLGTDILHIPRNQPTMNLEGFSLNTPDSEYKRVVPHETGHTLGFPHEHMRAELVQRLDPAKTFAWFARYQGWDRATVQQQVLTPLDELSLMGTPPDQDSCMCYQLPASITKDGQPIRGGTDIDESDYAFAAKFYPRAAACPEGETPETE